MLGTSWTKGCSICMRWRICKSSGAWEWGNVQNSEQISFLPHLMKTTRNCWSNSFAHRCTRCLWVSYSSSSQVCIRRCARHRKMSVVGDMSLTARPFRLLCVHVHTCKQWILVFRMMESTSVGCISKSVWQWSTNLWTKTAAREHLKLTSYSRIRVYLAVQVGNAIMQDPIYL